MCILVRRHSQVRARVRVRGAALVVRVGETQRRLDEREAQHTEALKSIAAGQEMQVFVWVLCVCTRRQKPRHAGESALGAET